MLSPETLEMYRRMTPGERLRLTLDLTNTALAALLSGEVQQVDRRLELLRLQNTQRNLAMLTGIARTKLKTEAVRDDEVNRASSL